MTDIWQLKSTKEKNSSAFIEIVLIKIKSLKVWLRLFSNLESRCVGCTKGTPIPEGKRGEEEEGESYFPYKRGTIEAVYRSPSP